MNNIIIDTGCANLFSVESAVKRLGYPVQISDDAQKISQADKVFLPGVGNARHAMDNIRRKNLNDTIKALKQPVLGFCLGMQLMTESSSEGAQSQEKQVQGLGVIPTSITPLQAEGLRLPHMGWNTLTRVSDHPVFNGIKAGDYFYFVHSFAAPVSEFTVAACRYGSAFSAAIAKDNFIGCQFHPERSGALGRKIIENFLEL